jgi:hypothetical protein
MNQSTDRDYGETPEEVFAKAAEEYRTPVVSGDAPKSFFYCLLGFLCLGWISDIFHRR